MWPDRERFLLMSETAASSFRLILVTQRQISPPLASALVEVGTSHHRSRSRRQLASSRETILLLRRRTDKSRKSAKR